jgi:hypothetical protein
MVEAISTGSFIVFAIALAIGAGATLIRVARYRVNGWDRPRLLTRDIQVIGGLALTVGSILFVRFLRTQGADVSGLATNVAWILFTTIPVLWSVVVYAWYELFVIERGAEQSYIERENPRDGS